MRSLPQALSAVIVLTGAGCLVDRSDLREPAPVGHDAGPPREDAAIDPAIDARLPPDLDAVVQVPDAFVSPDTFVSPDAYVEVPDAYVVPDAPPACVSTTEVCNGRDDDCNGGIDESVCGATLMSGGSAFCTSHARGDRTYLTCPFTAQWDQARALCQRFSPSYDLVAFADGAEQDAVRAWLDRDSWIGLTDSPSRVSAARDGDYRWVDGSSPSFLAWGDGEPRTDLADGCVLLELAGTWDAGSCDAGHYRGVVCEAAVP